MKLEDLPVDVQLRIDDECAAFECKCKSGESHDIKSHLTSFEGTERRVALRELLQIDAHYRSLVSGTTFSINELPSLHKDLATEILRELNDPENPLRLQSPVSCESKSNSLHDTQSHVRDGNSTNSQRAALGSTADNSAVDMPRELGPYVLEEKIGQGGMGTVWKATHRQMNRDVAIKLLASDRVGDHYSTRRFLREMRATASLEHEHFVRAYDAGEIDGQLYIAMELLDGCDLSKLIRRQGPMSVKEACRVAGQVARAMHHAHVNGSVHRDLKPSNIMLTSSGTAKILDLGLARVAEENESESSALTHDWELLGTLDYMSPEQFKDPRQVGPRSDIYSLGCTLFFLLSGRPPQSNIGNNEPVEDVRQSRGDVPASVSALLSRMMSKPLSGRPVDMIEVAAALDACQSAAEEGVQSTDAFKAASVGKWSWTALSLVGIAAIIGLVVWYLLH